MMLEVSLYKDIALIEAGGPVAVCIAVITQMLGDHGYMLLDPRIRA
jgi:peptide/nickel transport system permease protein